VSIYGGRKVARVCQGPDSVSFKGPVLRFQVSGLAVPSVHVRTYRAIVR